MNSPGGFVPHVEHDARGKAPLQRHLVDRAGRLAFGRRGVVIRGVDVGAGVRDRANLFDRPAAPLGIDQVVRPHAQKNRCICSRPSPSWRHIVNVGRHRLAGGLMLERHARDR